MRLQLEQTQTVRATIMSGGGSQAMYYGYPSIIEWTMGRLESIDRETFAEEKMKLAKCYQRNWRHVFPDDIRSKIESLLL